MTNGIPRTYWAVLVDENSTQYYDLVFLSHPTFKEVLLDLRTAVYERGMVYVANHQLIVTKALWQTHAAGQDDYPFNEGEAFEYSPTAGAWLRIVSSEHGPKLEQAV